MSFASAARARRGRLLSRAEAHAYIRALGKAFHAWCVVFPSDSAQHTCTQSLLCASRWLPLLLPLLLSSTPPRLLPSSLVILFLSCIHCVFSTPRPAMNDSGWFDPPLPSLGENDIVFSSVNGNPYQTDWTQHVFALATGNRSRMEFGAYVSKKS